MTNNFPQPHKVLVICAHPDDPEFGAAGTVTFWAKQGAEVVYVLVTDGSKGSAEPNMTKEKLIAARQEEQRNAAEVNVEDGMNVNQVIDHFRIDREDAYLVILNGVFVCTQDRDTTRLKSGDTLALWPEVAGG